MPTDCWKSWSSRNTLNITTSMQKLYGWWYISEYDECKRSKNGYEYTGRVSRTKSGKRCQRWDSQSPHKHSYKGLMAHENYCRNPEGKEDEPFCFTEEKSTRWEYCDVPFCSETFIDSSMYWWGMYKEFVVFGPSRESLTYFKRYKIRAMNNSLTERSP
jgi:integrin beta 3